KTTRNSSMMLQTSLEIAGNGQDSQKAQHAIDQRHVQIDGAARNMRVKRDQGNGDDGEHVDCRDAVNHRTSKYKAKQAKYDTEEDQNSGGDEQCFSQRSSPDVPRTARRWRASPLRDRSSARRASG